MSITSGFFNSINNDRLYNADDFGALFDGVISDGIFTTVYRDECFACSWAGSSGGKDYAYVARGKAWFQHTWITNDAQITLELPGRVNTYYTKVAICIVVDKQPEAGADHRVNRILAVKVGDTFSGDEDCRTTPLPADFLNPDTNVWRYPIAFVYLPGNGVVTTPTIDDNRSASNCGYSTLGTEVIGIDRGGTGATDAATARANLQAAVIGHNHNDLYYTKTDANTLLSSKADSSSVYTKAAVDTALAGKSSTTHNHDDRYFTESEVTTQLSAKANANNVYTKAEIDERLENIQQGVVDETKLPTIPISKGGTGAAAASKQAVREALEITPANIGAAAASHTHAASAIASGQIPIANGGTGASTAAGALTALGAAASSHTHTASAITSGQIPIANGGTGASSAAAARTALGINLSNLGAAASSHSHGAGDITSGTLPVARGGTGQTSLQNALDSLVGSGRIKLTSAHYGTSLPSSGNVAGRIFFLKV